MSNIRIKYVALSLAAEELFRKYSGSKAKEIKSITVASESPYTVLVEPRVSYLHRKAITMALKNPALRGSALADFERNARAALRDEGLSEDEYSLEVVV